MAEASMASKMMGCSYLGRSLCWNQSILNSRPAGAISSSPTVLTNVSRRLIVSSRLRMSPLFCSVMSRRAAFVLPENIRLENERASCWLLLL